LAVDYVLQRALSVSEGEQKEALINKIRPQLANMRRYSSAYSKHLISSACSSCSSSEFIVDEVVVVERLLEKSTGVPLGHENPTSNDL
jgi:pumilio RNA-binding family